MLCCTRFNQVLQTREEFVYIKVYYFVHGLGQVGNVDYGLTHHCDGIPESRLFLPALVPLKAGEEQFFSSLVGIFSQAAGAALIACTVVYAQPLLDNE